MKIIGQEQTRRRTFVKGASAVTVGAVGSMYVKPELRALGIPIAGASSAPKPADGSGYTPGFWLNNGTGLGLTYWNTGPSPEDPQWVANGGMDAQPFGQLTLFSSYFDAVNFVAGAAYTGIADTASMADMLTVGTANGADDVQKAARQVITSALNSAFLGSPPYTYSVANILSMWNTLASNPSSTFNDYKTLRDTLSAVNSV